MAKARLKAGEIEKLIAEQARDDRRMIRPKRTAKPRPRRQRLSLSAHVRGLCVAQLRARMDVLELSGFLSRKVKASDGALDDVVRVTCERIVARDFLDRALSSEALPRRAVGARGLSDRAMLTAFLETFRPLPFAIRSDSAARRLSAREMALVSIAGGNWPAAYPRTRLTELRKRARAARQSPDARWGWICQRIVAAEEAVFEDLILETRQGWRAIETLESDPPTDQRASVIAMTVDDRRFWICRPIPRGKGK